VSLSGPPRSGHPAGLPELFLDRSLGRIQVPRLLRAAGLRFERIRRRPAEKAMLMLAAVRCFVITRGDLRAEHMARRFLQNLDAMELACAEPGPFIYAVHERRLVRLSLD
jgi:hypothetical protein